MPEFLYNLPHPPRRGSSLVEIEDFLNRLYQSLVRYSFEKGAGTGSGATGPTGPTGPTGSSVSIGVAIGTTAVVSNNTEKSTSSTSYTKLKELRIDETVSGTVVVSFDLYSSGSGDVMARVYLNGVAVGDEETVTGSTPETFTYDYANPTNGDLIQVYGKRVTSGNDCYVLNHQLAYKWRINSISGETLASPLDLSKTTEILHTHQDP